MGVAPSQGVWSWPRYLCPVLLVGAAVAAPQSARAVGRLITPAQSAVHVQELRVAVAASPARTTVWVSLGLSADGSRALLVIPVEPGSLVDPVSEAWFEALESATAPRVLPPPGEDAADCGSSRATAHDTTRAAAGAPLTAAETAILTSPGDLEAYARSNELHVTSDDWVALSGAGADVAYLALAYELTAGDAFTRTLRISVAGQRSAVALGIAHRSGAAPVSATLYSFGEGRAQLVGLTELTPSSVDATWIASSATSDYLDRAETLLDQRHGRASLLESAGTDLLYSWSVLPTDAAVMPLVRRYLSFALELGDPRASIEACLADVWQARVSATVVSPACPPGLLARIPLTNGTDPACTEEPTAGETEPEVLRCEGADELAFALSGLKLQSAAVTRHRVLLTDQTPAELRLDWFAGPELTLAVHASEIDLTGCVVEHGSGRSGSIAVGSDGTGFVAESLTERDPEGETSRTVPPPPEEPRSYAEATFCCSGCAEPEPRPAPSPTARDDEETCSGDSSQYADDEETCAGDSSEYSDDEETCAGDSSEHSDDEETCSGDGSDSSDDYEGETCSGDGSGDSNYQGETCSGDSEAKVRAGCTASRWQLRRTRLSVLTLQLVAFLLPIRRRSRARRRQARSLTARAASRPEPPGGECEETCRTR